MTVTASLNDKTQAKVVEDLELRLRVYVDLQSHRTRVEDKPPGQRIRRWFSVTDNVSAKGFRKDCEIFGLPKTRKP